MTKKGLNLNNLRYFFFYSVTFFLLILSFINVKSYFKKQPEIQVLSAKTDVFDEEAYWFNFLKLNPNYFPGFLELAEIQITKGKRSDALNTIIKATGLNPNSEALKQLEFRLNQL